MVANVGSLLGQGLPARKIAGRNRRCPIAPIIDSGAQCARLLRPTAPECGLELRSPLSSARHRHRRRIGGSLPHRRPSYQGAKGGWLQGRHLSHQSQISRDARPHLLPACLGHRCALRPGRRGRSGSGCGASDPRLRQGRHSCGGGAHRRLSRNGRSRSSPGSRIEAGRHRQRRARHRPELPGHAVRARSRVGRVRQPD